MKTIASVLALTVLATGAHAQMAYETMATSSTETVGNVTTNVQTQYTSTTAVVPTNVIGDAPGTPALTSDGSVSVKLPTGEVLNIADSADVSWRKDPRVAAYDRFTFDPVSGAFIAGSGDVKFASNWDENGNRIVKKVAPAPKKKKVVKVEAVEETTTTTEAPVETPVMETPAVDVPAEEPAVTPAQ